MEMQTPDFAENLAEEIRVEMARQRRSNHDLAVELGVTDHTAGRRVNGEVPFNASDLAAVSEWLNIDIVALVKRATGRATHKEAIAA